MCVPAQMMPWCKKTVNLSCRWLPLVLFLVNSLIADAVCPGSYNFSKGDYNVTIVYDNVDRRALMHIPPNYDGHTQLPLVMNFHGDLGWPEQQAQLTGFSGKADQNGFIVVYPAGLNNSFNAGACCYPATVTQTDDVGFVNALLTTLNDDLVCMDTSRVFATGFSNGAFMSYFLACGGKFAAIGPVSGVLALMPWQTCNPPHPVPVLHIQGTADPIVSYGPPYTSNSPFGWPGANADIQTWSEYNHCNYNSNTSTFVNNSVHCEAVSCNSPASTNVTLCTVYNGGHAWPGGTGAFSGPGDISATDQIWEFFARSASQVPSSATALNVQYYCSYCSFLAVFVAWFMFWTS